MFGLSYRSVAKFLPLLNFVGSKSSIERDVAQASLQAQKLHNCAPRMRVRFAGVKAAIACTCGCAGTGAKTEK